ncbi:MAG: LysE family transporter [Elusimicrobia bacterium]|nr:LysE family transporter [Elusimicrobiota bacterium]
MQIFVLINIGFMLGFVVAIPTGACQIEVAKRSLHNHLISALMVIVGVATGDMLYGLIAFFGLAPFLENKIVVAAFEMVSMLLLWLLAYLTLKQSAKPHITHMDIQILRSKRVGYVTGFLLSLANPLMIFWWLIGAKIIMDLKVIGKFTSYDSVIFLFSGVLGMGAYLSVLAFILHWAKKFISLKTIQKINFAMGIALIILSLYFLYRSIQTFLS